jgi:hypothetical protein
MHTATSITAYLLTGYYMGIKYSCTPVSADSVSAVSVILGLPWPVKEKLENL